MPPKLPMSHICCKSGASRGTSSKTSSHRQMKRMQEKQHVQWSFWAALQRDMQASPPSTQFTCCSDKSLAALSQEVGPGPKKGRSHVGQPVQEMLGQAFPKRALWIFIRREKMPKSHAAMRVVLCMYHRCSSRPASGIANS